MEEKMKIGHKTIVSALLSTCLFVPALSAVASAYGNNQDPIAGAEAAGDARPQEDADNSADDLNARQRIRQTFSVKRRINGEIVEEKTITVPDDARFPTRATEATKDVRQFVRDKVDREVLTRREAVDEADLEFTLADSNIDGEMSKSEYLALYSTRKNDPNYTDFLNFDDDANHNGSEDRYAAFARADRQTYREAALARRFDLFAGKGSSLNHDDYIRAFLKDFDEMDADKNGMISGAEMVRLRHLLLTGERAAKD